MPKDDRRQPANNAEEIKVNRAASGIMSKNLAAINATAFEPFEGPMILFLHSSFPLGVKHVYQTFPKLGLFLSIRLRADLCLQ